MHTEICKERTKFVKKGPTFYPVDDIALSNEFMGQESHSLLGAGGDFQLTNDKHIGHVLRERLSVLAVSGEDGVGLGRVSQLQLDVRSWLFFSSFQTSRRRLAEINLKEF